MELVVSIYVISIIGAYLSIRYDDRCFDEKPWTLFLLFCPVVNTLLCIIEILFLIIELIDRIKNLNLDEKVYKLIRLGRK